MDPVHEPRARTTDVAVSPGPHVFDFGLSDSSMLMLNGNVTACVFTHGRVAGGRGAGKSA